MKKLIVLLCLSLAACSSKHVEVKYVYVDRPVSCVPADFPGEPQYVDSDEALKHGKDAADHYQLVAAGRAQRQDRSAQTEAVIKGCRNVR